MVKQGYEDWLRHRADHVVNNEKVDVIRNSTMQKIRCHKIRPGELLKIHRDCDVPCDAVLLWSSDPRGKCFVTTANLDGETSLKPLKVPSMSDQLDFEFVKNNHVFIECLQPETDIYTFHGKMGIRESGIQSPLGIENLLLRGSRVKNTEWAICCAVYTGKDTKLSLNSKITKNKFTSSESYINKFLIFYIILLILEMGLSYGIKRCLEKNCPGHQYYLGAYRDDSSMFKSVTQDVFSFMLLYFYSVPISLYVTIELHKFVGSLYINWDMDLYCNESNQPALANTSDLNEELGQIEILFSDKTGTLTKNDMYFQMCSVNGELYVERDKKLYEMNLSWYTGEVVESIDNLNPDLQFFFTTLALCHAVQVEDVRQTPIVNNNYIYDDDTIPTYQSMSSDEIAFVKAAANRGIVYHGEESNRLFLKIKGQMVSFEKLQVLEFTSARKRMSVIVRDGNNNIWLICKGADSAVLPLCNDSTLTGVVNSHVNFFAERGLRTMVVAYKQLTENEYHVITEEIIRVSMDVTGSINDTRKWRDIESGLTLLGATGVEDRLQDDVVETLESLREAGIKIWVLTGDKVETAINVSQSCGHIPSRSNKIFLTKILNNESLEEQIKECERISDSERNIPLTLVMDGQSFGLIVQSSIYQDAFVRISMKCNAVICCRLSPIQKSQIVRLIKKSKPKPITAAIGDGANDISMIQEAHVGFGIYGREGRQAARCADFAFKKFMMLKKILLVHGHWYYQRMGTLVQYSFYKNLAFVNLMLFFQIFCFFSTQSIFDSIFLMFFNVAFAAIPIFVLSLTEKCHKSSDLMNKPLLYKKQVDKKVLSWKNFFAWTLLGIYHSVVIFSFFFALWYFNGVLHSDGLVSGQWCFGAAMFCALVVVINLKLWMSTRYATWPFIAIVLLSIFAFFVIANIYSAVYIDESYDGDVLWTFIRLEESLSFWLALILIIVTCLLPDYLTLIFKAIFRKHLVDDPLAIEKIEIHVTKL